MDSVGGGIELEESFRIRSGRELSELLKLLWPSNFVINVDGAALKLDGASIQKSLHLYSSDTTELHRSRVRVSPWGKRIRVVHEEKSLVEGVKTEKRKSRTLKRKKAAKLLRDFGFVSSAIAKERLKLNYSGRLPNIDSDECRLSISLDKIVPFSLKLMRASGGATYDMDVDGDSSDSHRKFISTDYFANNIAPKITRLDLDTSKWKLGLTTEPFSLEGFQFADVESLLTRAMESLSE